MKIWVYKKNSNIVPAFPDDLELINKLPANDPFMITYVKVRNPAHHRKYFAFLKVVYDNLPEKYESHWPSPESFRRAMQMYAGFFEETISLKGERHLQPKSIKYESLDETEFSDLHNRVKNVIGKHILPEVSEDVFEREIEQLYMV